MKFFDGFSSLPLLSESFSKTRVKRDRNWEENACKLRSLREREKEAPTTHSSTLLVSDFLDLHPFGLFLHFSPFSFQKLVTHLGSLLCERADLHLLWKSVVSHPTLILLTLHFSDFGYRLLGECFSPVSFSLKSNKLPSHGSPVE